MHYLYYIIELVSWNQRWGTKFLPQYRLLGFFIWVFGFQIDIFVIGKIETPLKLHCVVKVPVYER